VAALPWNPWQLSRGMGGRLRLESVATLVRNTHSVFSVPILASIPVGDFWDQLLKLEPLAQSKVFSGLKARFEGGRLSKELSAEGAWLREFDRLGRERIKDLNPILRAQLKQRLSLFSSLLAEIEERE